MKNYLPCIAGVLLGLCFLAASIPVLFNLIKIPATDCPEGTPVWHFMQAFVPTGYVKFVKIFEFVGGIVVMIPRLRNLGLLLLGPVIVNIIAFHVFVGDPKHCSITNRCGCSMSSFSVRCICYWEKRAPSLPVC